MPTKLRPNANETASSSVCPRPCNVMLANEEATYLSDATVPVNGGKPVTSSRPYLIRASSKELGAPVRDCRVADRLHGPIPCFTFNLGGGLFQKSLAPTGYPAPFVSRRRI